MICGSFNRFFVKLLILLTIFAVSLSGTAIAKEEAKKKKSKPALKVTKIDKGNPKYASIVVDYDSGTILHADQADALRHPASLTKMMTLLMVFDALDSGRLSPNQKIKISKRAASMPASKLGLPAGSSIKIQDAIAALATESANDISVALAEELAGSESAFAQKMTAKAASIGMSRSKFYNASGLPNAYQVSTARDMARLARYLISHHPTRSQAFSKQRFTYQGRVHNNHNRLMETYAGMDCCKTGFINASGFNLVASAKRDGTRIIGVVFGGRSTVSRNVHMASLLDNGFDKVKDVRIASAKAKSPAQPLPPSLAPHKGPIENNVVLASASTNREVIREAYINAQQPAATEPAIKLQRMQKQTAQQQAPQRLAPAQGNLGTLQLSSLNSTQPVQPSARPAPQPQPSAQPLTQIAPGAGTQSWSIQIGAYQTKEATDQAIYSAQQKLPVHLKKAQSVIVPLRTADASWMFRARLAGFTQMEAREACQYFKDCLTISPQAY